MNAFLIGRMAIDFTPTPSPTEETDLVVECSVESSDSYTYISVLTETYVYLCAVSLGDDIANHTLRLRLCPADQDPAHCIRSAFIVTVPLRKPRLQIALLTETGAIVILDVSAYLIATSALLNGTEKQQDGGALGRSTDLDYPAFPAQYRSSVIPAHLHENGSADKSKPRCMSLVRPSEAAPPTDVSFVILAGCSDGSVLEIYGINGSYIKRHNVFSGHVPAFPIQGIYSSSSSSMGTFIVTECRSPASANMLLVLSTSHDRSGRSPHEAQRAAENNDEDDDGIWRECDPSFSYDDTAHLEKIRSFYVPNPEHVSAQQLTIPSPVILACLDTQGSGGRGAASNPAAVRIRHFPIQLPIPLTSSSGMQSYLDLGRHSLRGVKFLDHGSTFTVPPSFSTSDIFMATLSPALNAIFMYSLSAAAIPCALQAGASEQCPPLLQVDLLALLDQEGEEYVQQAALLSDGCLLLGTSLSRLVLCSRDLVVSRSFSLRGDIVKITPSVVITSSSVYAHYFALTDAPLVPAELDAEYAKIGPFLDGTDISAPPFWLSHTPPHLIEHSRTTQIFIKL